MKQYNKTYLPDAITYNGVTYYPNSAITSGMIANNTSLNTISATLKREGRKAICVNVLSKNLKGKTDLYRQPYKPMQHIFTNK